MPVTPWEAALGARVEVPLVEGRAAVKIPAGIQGSKRIRLKGKGPLGPQDMTLPGAGDLEGTVLGKNGQPVQGALVTIEPDVRATNEKLLKECGEETGLTFDAKKPRVVLVASISGGTGLVNFTNPSSFDG